MVDLAPQPPAPPSSARPPRLGLIIALSVLAGFLLTVVWSATFVDATIGDNIANTVLGHDAKEVPISGILAGLAFAFATGLAGSFTACNIAVFGTVAPLLGQTGTARSRLAAVLGPMRWLVVGMVGVSAVYGAIVGIVGTSMPQFSTAPNSVGLSPRSIQSMVVFGIIGLVFVYLGLAALGVVKDPLAKASERFPGARMLVLGVLIGGFLIGRPFGLFRQLFRDAAESGNPLYGAGAFVLQSVGNILIMVALAAVLVLVAGGPIGRWVAANPTRAAVMVGVSFIIVGVFTFLYWDVRLLARREILPWYPIAPWAG
ncbi:hypothetical protein [Sphaerisporangium sp. TRM90804]|uniref:hypothetical protein n=1 Tax=Sphaerisporangium sp. TRM90804 TaxID=3031113 RepID=UPI00244CE018|nr:hypothetical protein [Sphaerisporangium sp. TRM90804]MDH2429185.1 hypothetical protein [Sphaerisporangium sp. TRM90804]